MRGTFLLKTDIYGVFSGFKTENDCMEAVIPVYRVFQILCVSKIK